MRFLRREKLQKEEKLREREQRKQETLLERQQHAAFMQQGYDLLVRLSKFAPVFKGSGRSSEGAKLPSSDFRLVTKSGQPIGLLVDTFEMMNIYVDSENDKRQTKKILRALEGGSSRAIKSFQEVTRYFGEHIISKFL